MELNREILLSCISELRELHKKVHHDSQTKLEQLEALQRGEKIGCPVCDIGGSVMMDETMCEALNELTAQTLGSAGSLLAVFGLSRDVMANQSTILALGIMIGRKQKEIELMNSHHC